MMRVLLYLVLVFIFTSCSMFKSKTQKYVERTIASIEPNQLKVDEIDGRVFVSINFEVFGKHKGNNTFEVKSPYRLDNDIKHSLPYEVIVNGSDINCISNSSFKEIHKNYQYRNENKAVNNKLKCAYEGVEDKKIIAITYVFHKLKHIPLSDANSFIHPISRNTQDASRILESVKKGEEVSFFDTKLLFSFFAEKQVATVSPKSKGFPFKLKLNSKDVVQISGPRGEITIPKLGSFDFKGKENKQYYKSNQAGKKYIVSKDIKPYELVCSVLYAGKRTAVIERFQWSDKLQVSDALEVKCGINTKKLSKRKLAKVSGQFEFDVSVVRYNSLKSKVSDYLVDPQLKLNQFIDDINKSNLEVVKNYALRTIDAQKKKVEKETKISAYFPFTKNKELRIKQISIEHKPKVSEVVSHGKIYHYLDYNVYATPTMIDANGVISKPGKIFLGAVQTKHNINPKTVNLYDHEIFKVLCGKQYEENFLIGFVKLIKSNEEGDKNPIALSDYKDFINSVPRKICESDYSSPIETTLRRIEIQKCGEVTPYEKLVARNTEEFGQIAFDKIVASYDLFEGVHPQWSLGYYVLAKESLPLKKVDILKTNKKLDKVQGCVFISDEKAAQLLEN